MCAVGLLVLLALPALTEANRNDVPDDVVKAIGGKVSSIVFELGLTDLNLPKVQIGTVVPAYCLMADGELEPVEPTNYTIFDEFDQLVALAAVFYDTEKKPYAFMGGVDFAPALWQCCANGEGVALIYDKEGVYGWDGTSATLLARSNLCGDLTTDRGVLPETPVSKLAAAETRKLVPVRGLNQS